MEAEAKGVIFSSAFSDTTGEPDADISSLCTPSECGRSPAGSLDGAQGSKSLERCEAFAEKAPWVLVWCHEFCHKPQSLELREAVLNAAARFGGIVKAFKCSKKLQTWLAPVRRQRWALLTDFRELQRSAHILHDFPQNQPEFIAVHVAGPKQADRLCQVEADLRTHGLEVAMLTIRAPEEVEALANNMQTLKMMLPTESYNLESTADSTSDSRTASASSASTSPSEAAVDPAASCHFTGAYDASDPLRSCWFQTFTMPRSPSPATLALVPAMSARSAPWRAVWCSARSHSEDARPMRKTITRMVEGLGGSLTAFTHAHAFKLWLSSARGARYVLLCDGEQLDACIEALRLARTPSPEDVVVFCPDSAEPACASSWSTAGSFEQAAQRPVQFASSTAELGELFKTMANRTPGVPGPTREAVSSAASDDVFAFSGSSEVPASVLTSNMHVPEALSPDVLRVLGPVLRTTTDAAAFARHLSAMAPEVYED